MSRLASLLLRAAEARGVSLGEDAPPTSGTGPGTAAGTTSGGGSGPSVYGTKSYWESRYEDGVIGACARKGVLSNEWCAPRAHRGVVSFSLSSFPPFVV